MSEKKTDLKARLMEETKTMLFVWVYLALLLGSFTTYRKLLLAEYHISYVRYGYSVFEAFVLAKVIVFGRFLGIGERFRGRPLIITTLYKTLWFSILVLAFSILEHLIVGLCHGDRPAKVIEDLMNRGIWETLAQVMVLFFALAPLFAFWETERVLGEGKLFGLFFKQTASLLPNLSDGSGTESRA